MSAPTTSSPRVMVHGHSRGLPDHSISGWHFGLIGRLIFVAVLIAAEWIPLLKSLRCLHVHGHAVFRVCVVCLSLYFAVGYAKFGNSFRRISNTIETVPFQWRYFAGHIFSLLAFVYLTQTFGEAPGTTPPIWIVAPAYFCAVSAVICVLFAFIPRSSVAELLRTARSAWLYAVPVGLIASALMSFAPDTGDFIWNGPVWRVSADLVFTTVKALLSVALPDLIADRSTMTLGTPQFLVTILSGCTGWEGTALMLVFSSSWLFFLRNEFRFPQALLLVPSAMAFMWVCNAVRITVLVLIGAAGAADIALKGFHSEAGWIAFNGVALGFAIGASKLSWFALQRPEKREKHDFFSSATVTHLLPFLSLLAAGMISRAASGGFEWLYPLRFLGVAAVLWRFRRSYTQLDWRFSRLAAVIGGTVCLIWVALAQLNPVPPQAETAAALAALPSFFRIPWVLCRILAATITVPIAEELAFRGFLIRRLLSRDFDGLGPRAYTWWSVLLSSLAFGALHGGQWLAGSIAGILYAAIYLRRGRIGDAVLAHATTNGLLAAWVLWTGDWSLW